MAALSRLKVEDFRNLKAVDLQTSRRFNLIVGSNGSGKTSALEAIHVLSVGRSFRTHKLDPLVATDSSQFLIYGEFAEASRIGLQRGRSGSPTLRLNGETQAGWAEIATLLPLQVINTDSFSLLEGGGKARRRFLDWAMFHVEHSYLPDWRAYRRIVSQRNMLLKQKPRDLHQQLDAWDLDLARLAQAIHHRRSALIEEFLPIFTNLVSEFLPGTPAALEYLPGWNVDMPIEVAFFESRERDIRYGMTLLGPHRADFNVKVNRHAAIEVLSRGQIKMLVCALKLSMGQFIKARYSRSDEQYRSIYLIDDLAAELDHINCGLVIDYLWNTDDQCFFTAIEESALLKVAELTESSGKFHVEHGKISPSYAAV
ncbi:MAG: DNA replication/repair protein RecF [Pseudohongiella sp.]|nr:DNA replication/repair protein RecF [Pseudohongiella sp.]